ncbi:MAG: aminotransferase class IV [Anaerolineae bacterium]
MIHRTISRIPARNLCQWCPLYNRARQRRQNPSAKTTGWMHDRDQVNLPEGIFTGLLLDFEGKILEGMSSNFYAILNGELRTAGEGVLPGIAQQIIFEIAPQSFLSNVKQCVWTTFHISVKPLLVAVLEVLCRWWKLTELGWVTVNRDQKRENCEKHMQCG